MNLRYIHTCLLSLTCLLMMSSCGSKSKPGQPIDGTYKISAADTVSTSVKILINKAEELISSNRMTDAAAYLTPNIHRFGGSEKAELLNERGSAYFLKDDLEKAVSDYLAASDLDPTNSTYLLNVANAYTALEKMSNAAFFAKKMLEIKTASDSDVISANAIIERYEQTHAGK